MKYRVAVRRVVGPSGRTPTAPFKRAYCGISLGNRAFADGRLAALLGWLANHVRCCRLVIGDDLHRLNLMMRGQSEARALQEARCLGSEFIQHLLPLLHQYPNEQFIVSRWSEITGHPDFPKWRRKVERLADENQNFMQSLVVSAKSYVKRQMTGNTRIGVPADNALALSVQYLMEEITGFALLSSEGWTIDIYPGSELPVLVDLTVGKFPTAPKPLFGRTNVEVRIRQRTSRRSRGAV